MVFLNWYLSLPDWAMLVIAVIIVILIVPPIAKLFKGEEPTPRTLHSEEQPKVDAAFDFVDLEKTKEEYKKIGAARHKNKVRLDPTWIGVGILAVALVFVLLSGLKSAFPEFMEPKYVVKSGQSCTGIRNGQYVLLPEGTDLIVGQDICDEAIVQKDTPKQTLPAPVNETSTTVSTQAPTETVQTPESQSADPTPIAKLPKAITYGVLIKENGVYGVVGYPFVAQAESLERLRVITSAPCGQEMSFESDTVYALVYTDDSVVDAPIEVTANGITVSCEYGTVIYAEPIK